jgi:hypothetical protein
VLATASSNLLDWIGLCILISLLAKRVPAAEKNWWWIVLYASQGKAGDQSLACYFVLSVTALRVLSQHIIKMMMMMMMMMMIIIIIIQMIIILQRSLNYTKP